MTWVGTGAGVDVGVDVEVGVELGEEGGGVADVLVGIVTDEDGAVAEGDEDVADGEGITSAIAAILVQISGVLL